jgi:hypothetical protein
MLVLGLAMMAGMVGGAWAATLPSEPSEEYLVNEDVNIVTGFYFREYSLARDGVVDYRTARQILQAEYNEYWNTVVEAEDFPLFYWYDADHTGTFEMWVDRNVEGCTCDIVPYQAIHDR